MEPEYPPLPVSRTSGRPRPAYISKSETYPVSPTLKQCLTATFSEEIQSRFTNRSVEFFPLKLKPTLTHRFYKLLANKGLLRRVFTQNIDALEFLTGLQPEKVVEAHGTFHRAYCSQCKAQYSLEWLTNEIRNARDETSVPTCESCRGVVRPDVVLFGEALPDEFWTKARSDFPHCDLLIVMGTSLAVAPFNTLVGRPKASVPRVYINKSKPGAATNFLGWVMGLRGDVSFKNAK